MAKKIMPPTYFIILLLLSAGFHFIFPVFKFIFPPYNYLGIGLIIFGIVMNLWADFLFKRKWTTVKPEEMPAVFITAGPFRLSRHPMYAGMASVLAGTAIFLGSLSPFIFPLLFIIIIEKLFIPGEEKNLGKKFGGEYFAYQKRVRRWL